MRKFSAKNLRREVQKQLKELRGGVGEQAVGNGLKVKSLVFCDRHPATGVSVDMFHVYSVLWAKTDTYERKGETLND